MTEKVIEILVEVPDDPMSYAPEYIIDNIDDLNLADGEIITLEAEALAQAKTTVDFLHAKVLCVAKNFGGVTQVINDVATPLIPLYVSPGMYYSNFTIGTDGGTRVTPILWGQNGTGELVLFVRLKYTKYNSANPT